MTTRRALTAEAHAWTDGTLVVQIDTDLPAHAWLRWTDHPEWVHLRGELKRGALYMADPKYCFVAWHEVEQDEAGDTLHHTFTFDGWLPGT